MFISHHDHYKGSLSRSLSRLSTRSFNLMSSCNDPIVVQTPAKPSSSGSISLDGRRSGDVLDPNAKDAFASTAGSNPCGQLTMQNEYYAQATRPQKARAKELRIGVKAPRFIGVHPTEEHVEFVVGRRFVVPRCICGDFIDPTCQAAILYVD